MKLKMQFPVNKVHKKKWYYNYKLQVKHDFFFLLTSFSFFYRKKSGNVIEFIATVVVVITIC